MNPHHGVRSAAASRVLFDGQIFKQLQRLKGPNQAFFDSLVWRVVGDVKSAKQDLSAAMDHAGDSVDEGGFACSVGSDQPGQGASFKFEVDVVERQNTPELNR